MTWMLAYCGLTCQACPIYLATRQENKEEQARLRAGIAGLCKEHYGVIYSVDEISDCDGCRAEGGRLFSPSKTCSIRACARERKLENCAYCPQYACERLETFFRKETAAKTRLDAIRNSLL